jgi:RNA polymerase sigma-70 factor (ECF subfamily)
MMKPSEPTPDDELARTVQSHAATPAGERALGALLDRWQERIYRWAWKYVRDREEALDVTQDCLMLITRGLANYEPRGQFGAWVYAIVRRRCLTALRPRVLARDREVEMDSIVAPTRGPDADAEHREREERVLAAMRRALEPREQLALWLRAYEEMSVEDITRRLALEGETGARGLLQTARRKLRAALGEIDGEEES